MEKTIYSDNDWNHLHDAVLTATGESYKQPKLRAIYGALPDNLKDLAEAYGMNDTVFRDGVIEWINERKKTSPYTFTDSPAYTALNTVMTATNAFLLTMGSIKNSASAGNYRITVYRELKLGEVTDTFLLDYKLNGVWIHMTKLQFSHKDDVLRMVEKNTEVDLRDKWKVFRKAFLSYGYNEIVYATNN